MSGEGALPVSDSGAPTRALWPASLPGGQRFPWGPAAVGGQLPRPQALEGEQRGACPEGGGRRGAGARSQESRHPEKVGRGRPQHWTVLRVLPSW